jgi:hypothetical protein
VVPLHSVPAVAKLLPKLGDIQRDEGDASVKVLPPVTLTATYQILLASLGLHPLLIVLAELNTIIKEEI